MHVRPVRTNFTAAKFNRKKKKKKGKKSKHTHLSHLLPPSIFIITMYDLTAGSIAYALRSTGAGVSDPQFREPVVQVLNIKKITGATGAASDRFRHVCEFHPVLFHSLSCSN